MTKFGKFLAVLSAIFLVFILLPLDTAEASTTTACDTSWLPNPANVSDAQGNKATMNEYILYIETLKDQNTGKTKYVFTCINTYEAFYKSGGGNSAQGTSQEQASFNTRYDACMNGQNLSLLSPKTWVNSLKCLFTTSFFPSGTVLSSDFNQLKDVMNSHVPTSYFIFAGSFFTSIASNWGSATCSAKDLTFTIKLPTVGTETFALPCEPPTALHALRYLMVIAVWLGLAFFAFRVGVNFWGEITG